MHVTLNEWGFGFSLAESSPLTHRYVRVQRNSTLLLKFSGIKYKLINAHGVTQNIGVFWIAENRSLQLHSPVLICHVYLIAKDFEVKCATFRNHVLGHRKPCASLLDSVTQSRMCGSCYRETDCSSFRVIPGWEELPH